MGRPQKFNEETRPCSIRVPLSFIATVPIGISVSEHVFNTILEKTKSAAVGSMSNEQKQALGIVIKLFKESLEINEFADKIDAERINAIDILEKILA